MGEGDRPALIVAVVPFLRKNNTAPITTAAAIRIMMTVDVFTL
jgi:hypothetical protein